jgi:hypothetical protein
MKHEKTILHVLLAIIVGAVVYCFFLLNITASGQDFNLDPNNTAIQQLGNSEDTPYTYEQEVRWSEGNIYYGQTI